MGSVSKALILFVLGWIPSVACAEVKYLRQGEPAPYTGYLFDSEEERRVRNLDQEVVVQNQKIEVLTKINKNTLELYDLANKRAEVWQKQSDDLSKQLVAQKKDDFFTSAFYFTLGAVLTGLTAYGVSRSIR